MALEQAAEVGPIVGRVDEGVARRCGIDGKLHHVWRVSHEIQLALDAKLRRALMKRGECDRVAEHIVHPAQIGLGRNLELGLHDPQIVAVARTQHHPVLAEFHRIGVAIGRGVTNVEGEH